MGKVFVLDYYLNVVVHRLISGANYSFIIGLALDGICLVKRVTREEAIMGIYIEVTSLFISIAVLEDFTPYRAINSRPADSFITIDNIMPDTRVTDRPRDSKVSCSDYMLMLAFIF